LNESHGFSVQRIQIFVLLTRGKTIHIHVWCPNGEVKIWLEPEIELAMNKGLKEHELNEILRVTKERADEIRKSWEKHFNN